MTGLPASPAAARNKGPILDVLKAWMPGQGPVIEIAAGTGQHAVHFAAALPGVTWQPSDADADAVDIIARRVAQARLANLRAPIRLDVLDPPDIPEGSFMGMTAINLIHIAPWPVTPALMDLAWRALAPGGRLLLYGPYRANGQHTAPSNAAFDGWLKSQNTGWGVRDLGEVVDEGRRHGLIHCKTVAMPANNLSVLFTRG
ncbi:MAG: DUF938 domain-containing protein [Alphaproteobacteria bacterium]|nr:MAG: DUF938 domain-containing protein [Alphaproteobacteria bacterium]